MSCIQRSVVLDVVRVCELVDLSPCSERREPFDATSWPSALDPERSRRVEDPVTDSTDGVHPARSSCGIRLSNTRLTLPPGGPARTKSCLARTESGSRWSGATSRRLGRGGVGLSRLIFLRRAAVCRLQSPAGMGLLDIVFHRSASMTRHDHGNVRSTCSSRACAPGQV
jgi:hypothetical protein